MNRKAIIVTSPGPFGEDDTSYLAGVEQDANHYDEFFKSDHGGAWAAAEIEHFVHPEKEDLLDYLGALNVDYSVTVFCGHGGTHEGATYIKLNEGSYLRLNHFCTGALRQLTIADSCRQEAPLDPWQLKEGDARFGFEKRADADAATYRNSCRNLYANCISTAPEHRVIMMGCDLGQTAQEDSTGGYFSRALLRRAINTAQDAKSNPRVAGKVLNVYKAFDMVCAALNSEGYPQRPKIVRGRATATFPFVVG